jgi:hypothetical protein
LGPDRRLDVRQQFLRARIGELRVIDPKSAEDLTTDDHLLAVIKRMPASSTATHDSPFE